MGNSIYMAGTKDDAQAIILGTVPTCPLPYLLLRQEKAVTLPTGKVTAYIIEATF
jgi:hypothetical protein